MTTAAHPTVAVTVGARPGLLLHLSGPLQSWGERSRFNERDTATFPTRSGLIGMIAAALGHGRDRSPKELSALRFAIRADRPGVVLRDFHTVGGGLPARNTVRTASGKPRTAEAATLVSHRYYLQDAAFTVAVTSADGDTTLLEHCAAALEEPHWPPYLGRRSCPPDTPVLLARTTNAWRSLTHLPLHRKQQHQRPAEQPATAVARAGRGSGLVTVVLHADEPLDQLVVPDDCTLTDDMSSSPVNDEPISFDPANRLYRTRLVHRRSMRVPASRFGGLGSRFLATAADSLDESPRQERR